VPTVEYLRNLKFFDCATPSGRLRIHPYFGAAPVLGGICSPCLPATRSTHHPLLKAKAQQQGTPSVFYGLHQQSRFSTRKSIDREKPLKIRSFYRAKRHRLWGGFGARRLARCGEDPIRPAGIDFEQFWQLYPRRVGKGHARVAFEKIVRAGRVTVHELKAGAKRYAAECAAANREPRYIKHPQIWLNGECWAEEPLSMEKGDLGASRAHGKVAAVGGWDPRP
jgi:hypothetical protein